MYLFDVSVLCANLHVKDSSGVQHGVIDRGDKSTSSSDRGGLTELEKILKQKTFTR